jgi:hypothetical protein
MPLYTVIIGEGAGENPKGYKVRANDPSLAATHARNVYRGHNGGSSGQIMFIMEGEVTFLPTYTRDAFPSEVLDLGTALFGDGQ